MESIKSICENTRNLLEEKFGNIQFIEEGHEYFIEDEKYTNAEMIAVKSAIIITRSLFCLILFDKTMNVKGELSYFDGLMDFSKGILFTEAT